MRTHLHTSQIVVRKFALNDSVIMACMLDLVWIE